MQRNRKKKRLKIIKIKKNKIMLFIPIAVSLFSILFAIFLIREINKLPSGQGKMLEVSQAIREGAVAFLKRQYRTVGITAVVIFFILLFILGFKTALGFIIGAVASSLSGYIGMMVSTQANVKVAEAAKSGLKPALSLAFRGGSVTGFLVAGLGLFSISVFYFLTKDLGALIALGFGGSLISVFARLGGGIYTKAADVGADLVGKVEKGIPEDDPRNPAVIADQVGDNVGDCAGMAADLFETYVVTLVAAMVLGALIFPNISQAVLLPLILGSVAILACIIATFFVRLPKSKSIMSAFYRGLIVAGVLSAIGFFPVISQFAKIFDVEVKSLYLPALVGLLIAAGMFLITEFFTSKSHSPVKSIASLNPHVQILKTAKINRAIENV